MITQSFRIVIYFILILLQGVIALDNTIAAQEVDLSFLPTRAEATHFEETTRYDELMGFLEVVTANSERLHLTSFGYSAEGRALPLVIYGDLADASPQAVRATGKTRMFIQGNIHAGEVCGKEALLLLIRSLASGNHEAWSDSLVILMAPIYNADGNERVSLFNRPRQHGPRGGMGQRPSAQDYDLNRDHMKLDSPEARSLVRLLKNYDPHVIVDLHTTNGTRHAYHLTYAPPLNPNTHSAIDQLLREDWFPAVTATILEKYGWHYYYYGNLPWRGSNREQGWYTFDHRPRFNNNYVGLRNRIAILSEAYAYATFEDRILATRYFVEEILNYAVENATLIRETTVKADTSKIVGTRLALTATLARSEEPVEIMMGDVVEETNPYNGRIILRREEVVRPETMFEYGSFSAEETEVVPEAYFIHPEHVVLVRHLEAHGIQYRITEQEQTLKLSRFKIDSTSANPRVFQGHRERRLFGAYEAMDSLIPAGAIVIPTEQPLGRLAFYLLEPRSDDGLLNWGLLDKQVENANYYPIQRIEAFH